MPNYSEKVLLKLGRNHRWQEVIKETLPIPPKGFILQAIKGNKK